MTGSNYRHLIDFNQDNENFKTFYNPDLTYVVTYCRLKLDIKNHYYAVLTLNEYNNISHKKFFLLNIPLKYVLNFPIGSLWRNLEVSGFIPHKDTEKIKFNGINIKYIKAKQLYKNLSIPDFAIPYVDYYKDKLIDFISIEYNKLIFILHPIYFLMTTYGHTVGLVESILTNPNSVIESTNLTFENNEIHIRHKYAKIDSAHLYLLKKDLYTRNSILSLYNYTSNLSARNQYFDYKVQPFYKGELSLQVEGVQINNYFICYRITKVSTPKTPVIFYDGEVYNYHKNNNQSCQSMSEFKYSHSTKLEDFDYEIINQPADSTEYVTRSTNIRILDDASNIKSFIKHKDIYKNNVNFIQYPSSESYSALNRTGHGGTIGQIFFEHEGLNLDSEFCSSRLSKIYQDAIFLTTLDSHAQLHILNNEMKFDTINRVRTLQIQKILNKRIYRYPYEVMVLRLFYEQTLFAIISFPENKNGSGLSSIVCMIDDDSFFHTKDSYSLYGILLNIIKHKCVSAELREKFRECLSTFKHVITEQGNNNWVLNGVTKLLDR